MNAVIEQLKTEREHLEQQCRGAQVRIDQLTMAINALEGRIEAPAGASGMRNGPSVTDMIEAAAREMPTGATFDFSSLLKKAQPMFPMQSDKIKRGIYTGIAALIKRGTFIRAPGGFQLAKA